MDNLSNAVKTAVIKEIAIIEGELPGLAAKVQAAQAEYNDRRNTLKELKEFITRGEKGSEDVQTVNPPAAVSKGKGSINNTYPDKSNLWTKLRYILLDNHRVLHNREIADEIIKHEPDEGHNRQDLINKLSTRLSAFKRNGELKAIQVFGSNQNTFYGLPEFFEGDSVKEGYEYNDDALIYRFANKEGNEDLFQIKENNESENKIE